MLEIKDDYQLLPNSLLEIDKILELMDAINSK